MTRVDQVKLMHFRRDAIQTIKSIVLEGLYGFWEIILSLVSFKALGFAIIVLGLRIMTNASTLHSPALGAVSLVFIVIGFKIRKQ